MKKIKRDSGITLIALVVTIIVLLILAGISISMLTGESGIITQAKKSKIETENAAVDEQQKIDSINSFIENYKQGIVIEKVEDEAPGVLEGRGTEDSPYIISSIEDLLIFSHNVREGNNYEGKIIELKQNLDFQNNNSYANPNREDYAEYGYNGKIKEILTKKTGFIPIGNTNNNKVKELNNFSGIFNGNNYAIINLYINEKTEEDKLYGLFATNLGEIKDLKLINCKINVEGKSSLAGGIAGRNYWTIRNCVVNGKIENKGTLWLLTGGIAGDLKENGTIINCGNTAEIICNNIGETGQAVAAGIVGACNHEDDYISTIRNCFNSGKIISNSENSDTLAGGISTLIINCDVKNCYNTGDINGYSIKNAYIGGIVGGGGANYKQYSLENLYNTGNIFLKGRIDNADTHIGGIIGKNYNLSSKNVFNKGNIKVEGENKKIRIGGIAGGYAAGHITNGYNVGKITAPNTQSDSIGSIIGYKVGNCKNCYFLKGTYDKGIGTLGNEGQKNEGVEEKNDILEFPTILEVVNKDGSFKEDINNINNKEPILNWQ